MRARAGDPPRTMAQKIFAGRCADPALTGDLVQVKVDQVVLARSPSRAFAEGMQAGLKKTPVEVAIAYDGTCVTDALHRGDVPAEMAACGIAIGRPGVGYAAPVHLERYASPARLCVTDEPRLASVGGVGLLSLVVPPGQLGQALAHGNVWVRPPRSVQVLLSGKTRPFVCARDVALELVRRGIGDAIRKVEDEHQAPVVLEFAGPSARLLSVAERSVLCGLAPQLGAAAAIFVGDERTEVFLRDQRRSKAHRTLAPDPGAPCDEVMNVDLAAVDPLLLDDAGQVRAVRDLAGKPVSQVILGGDGGVTLRDLFAAATLLKSKRVPAGLDFVIPVPSRQVLEVLASSGALADLIATGARIVEPDARIMLGELYPPPPGGISLRTCDPEPRAPVPFAVASAETLAWAVATGEVGDPRSFKRPVRVTVPRTLPTDDVLVARGRDGAARAQRALHSDTSKRIPPVLPGVPWKGPQSLDLVAPSHAVAPNGKAVAVVCMTLDEVRQIAVRAADLAPTVRAVLAPFIPSGVVGLLSGVGIAALQVELATAKELKGTLALPAPAQWAEKAPTTIAHAGDEIPLQWLALGAERLWATVGSARPAPKR
jgi:aconitate hydratase